MVEERQIPREPFAGFYEPIDCQPMEHHPHLNAVPFVLEPQYPKDRLVEGVTRLDDVVVNGVHS